MTIENLLSDKSIAVVCGSGGVGKTTTAAAIGLMAATTTNKRVLVLTIDPARRLADVLGMKAQGNEIVNVEDTLFAQMLDTKQAWDDLVTEHAPDESTASRIRNNPLYGEITERFVQSHDYIAMETLYLLHASGDYDLIVIDTPPASQAVDFLDAPERMTSFFDSRLLKFLIAPARSSLLNFTSRAFLQVADKLLGRRFLEDITELFTLLETMRPGFIERADQVDAILRAKTTSFIAVTTPEPAPAKSAARFIEQLESRDLQLGAVIFNKVLPPVLTSAEAKHAASELFDNAAVVAQRFDNPVAAERVIVGATENFDRFARLAHAERSSHDELAGGRAVQARAPWFSNDLSDVHALRLLGESIWS